MTEQQLATVKLGKPYRWVRTGSAINRSEEDAIAYAVDCVPSSVQATLHADAPRGPWYYEVKSQRENVESPEGFPSKNDALQALKNWLMSHA